MGLVEGRRRRRRARELERRLQELDRLDQQLGLGALPPSYYPPAPRRRAGGGPAFLLALVVAAGVAAWQLGLLPEQVRGALGDPLADGDDLFAPRPVAGAPAAAGAPREPESSGDGYTFLALQPHSDEPVGYDPCRTVEVVVNPDGAPEDYQTLVQTAVSRTAAATGLDIVLAGTTTDRRYQDRDAGDPVLVMWADEAEVPELEGPTAGIGGSTSMSVGAGPWRYVSGIVVLDGPDFRDIQRDAARQAVVDHEFGHLVGLGHVEDPRQLMHATTTGTTRFAEGDLEGLAALGATGCH